MQMPPLDPFRYELPPPWWQGPLVTIGFILALFAAIAFLSGCAEYTLSLSVNSDKGSVSFSKSGIEVTVEK